MRHLGKVAAIDCTEIDFQLTGEIDLAVMPITDADLDLPMDRGIRAYVHALRDGGIDTFESCEGGDGHAFLEPTVRFFGDRAEAFRALAVAQDSGLPVCKLRQSYVIEDGKAEGPWWEMVFATTDPTS